VAVLGTEAAKPHEITAIALGAGDAAALALALMPHVNGPVAPAPTAVQSPNAPKPAAGEPSSKTEPVAASKPEPPSTPKAELTSPAKTEPASTAKIAAKSERPAATAPPSVAALSVAATPASTVVSTPTTATAPTPATATAPTVTSATAAAPTPAPIVPPSAKAAAPPVSDSPAPRVVETPTPGPALGEKASSEKALEPTGDGPRWTELRGTVKVIAGNWIVVRADNGQLVLVDLSTVRGGAASLKPGVAIALYGTPTEQKFQAMGIVQPENRPAAKPATVPPRR